MEIVSLVFIPNLDVCNHLKIVRQLLNIEIQIISHYFVLVFENIKFLKTNQKGLHFNPTWDQYGPIWTPMGPYEWVRQKQTQMVRRVLSVITILGDCTGLADTRVNG